MMLSENVVTASILDASMFRMLSTASAPTFTETDSGIQAMGPISVMESEHDEAGELLEVIKHTTNNVTPPPEACTTWKAMYNGINELIDDLMDHISLENNVLFPRALAGE